MALAEAFSGPVSAPPTIDGADDGSIGGAPVEEEPDAPPKYPYSVARGGAITSLRGILAPGEEVRAEDFSGGAQTLAHLVSVGLVLEAKG